MDRTLGDFIKVLRGADVRVSVAETLDAINAVDVVGYDDRALLKNSLSLVLAKTAAEKESFDSVFDRFFSFDRFAEGDKSLLEVGVETLGEDEFGGADGPGGQEPADDDGCDLGGGRRGGAAWLVLGVLLLLRRRKRR